MKKKTNEELQIEMEKHEIDKGGSWHSDHVSDSFLYLVKKHLRNNVLDVGAGSGSLVARLRKMGYKAEGIDLYPKSKLVRQGSITDLPYETNSFDLVFCTEVLEHLTDEQLSEAIVEIRRVTRPGGKFILSVPYNENLGANSFLCEKCGHNNHPFRHKQSIDEKRIRKILGRHFRILEYKICPLHLIGKIPKLLRNRFTIKFLSKKINSSNTMIVVSHVN